MKKRTNSDSRYDCVWLACCLKQPSEGLKWSHALLK